MEPKNRKAKRAKFDVQEPSEGIKFTSKFIAMVVRNEMEEFHKKHLTDEQMEELNPIIRNAICTALQAQRFANESQAAYRFAYLTEKGIPSYWEEPQLTSGFLKMVDEEKRGEL